MPSGTSKGKPNKELGGEPKQETKPFVVDPQFGDMSSLLQGAGLLALVCSCAQIR